MATDPGSISVADDGSYSGSGLAYDRFAAKVATQAAYWASVPIDPSIEDRLRFFRIWAAEIEGDSEPIAAAIDAGGGGGGGGVTSVTGTPPIASSGGATPAISIAAASGASAGSMSAADFTKLAGISSGATVFTTEDAQDAVGAALTDTATIDLTYNDGANQITADVIDDSITNAKLANMATQTFKGRTTAGTGDPQDLTATQATAMLDLASGSTKGLYTDEMAQDAVGTILADTATIDFTYDDAGNAISAIVKDASITVAKLDPGVHGLMLALQQGCYL